MRILTLIMALLLPATATANDWPALGEPGAIAIMRHAIAPGTGDPPDFRLGDCATQRNLDETGRDQARAIGAEFRARGIAFDAVLTSQWCRTRETAALLSLGSVEDAPPLNSFFQDRSNGDRQTREALELIAERDGRLMLVTHYVNILALTGQAVRSGEVLVITLEDGKVRVLGSIMIEP